MSPVSRLLRTSFVALAALTISAVAGCTAGSSSTAGAPSTPEGFALAEADGGPTGMWIERGESFAIVTTGSSSCAPVPTGIRAEASDRVVVSFAASTSDPCSADMAPTTHRFDLPDGITAEGAITVDIEGSGSPRTSRITLE